MIKLVISAFAFLVFMIGSGVDANSVHASQKLTSAASEETIARSNAFGALVPDGRKTSLEENQALVAALSSYRKSSFSDNVAPILAFMKRFPNSAWNPSLLLNLGITYRNTGHFSLAEATLNEAWKRSRALGDPTGEALADTALGKLASYYAYVGDEQKLGDLLQSAKGRSLTGPATVDMSNAASQLATMRKEPEIAFRCGAWALQRICRLSDKATDASGLLSSRAQPGGMSLSHLLQLSKNAGLNYQMAYRRPGASLIAPAVINWKVGHYATVVATAGGLYRVSDTATGDIWVREPTIDEEASGYFLVPVGTLPDGWRAVGVAEGNTIWGRGPVGPNTSPGPGPTDPQAFPQCNSSGADNGGITTWNVAAMSVSLELHDKLLSYKPSIGPPVTFEIFYNQRDYQNAGNAVFQYTNFGPKWTSNWISYIDAVGFTSGPGAIINGGTAQLYLPGGGIETYEFPVPSALPVSTPGLLTQAKLSMQVVKANIPKPTKHNRSNSNLNVGVNQGAQGGGSGSTVVETQPPPSASYTYEFVRELPDGSKQVFALNVPLISSTGQNSGRFFLTQVIDPQGHITSLSYDSQTRITAITDASGNATRLLYGLPSNPRQVTSVVAPHGRTATFTYSADGSHLVSATDPEGITSTYTYAQSTSDKDFVTALTTPYGTTTFLPNTGDPGTDIDQVFSDFWRSLKVTDPAGLISRIDQREMAPGIPEKSDQISPPGLNVDPLALQYIANRNVFIWDPYQLSLAMNTPNSDGSPDYTKAHILHFLHANPTTASFVLESTKNPLESRVWYVYANQPPKSNTVGTSNKPTSVGRILDDGTSQITTFQRNDFGHITQLIDPVQRQFTFVYDPADGIDLQSVLATTNGSSLTLFSATYNSYHEPLTVTDAAGETSTVTYNNDRQPLTFTNALNQTTSYTYDSASHFLTSVQVSPDGQNQVSQLIFGPPDAYGRVHTVTNELGYTETLSYDLYDRPTSIAFPDGTTETWNYTSFDHNTHDRTISFTDRMNHTTNYAHDLDRRLTSITDPLGHTTQFGYCGCGTVSSVTDPNLNTTSFDYDVDNRMIARHYADGSQTIYGYEATTRRLKSVLNTSGHGATYTYFHDNSLHTVSDPTRSGSPSVQFAYDPVFVRVTSMTDSSGTTTFSYYPTASSSPVKGGNRLKAEMNARGDTISFAYDELGRLMSRTVDGVISSQAYDALNRLSVVTNPLGTFTYQYNGTSKQVYSVTSSSGPQEQISYHDVTQDNLVKQISWFGPPPKPVPPSPACTADRQTMANLQSTLQADQNWLNQWCSRTSASPGRNPTAGAPAPVVSATNPYGCSQSATTQCQQMAAESLTSECRDYGAGYCFSVSCDQSEISAQLTKIAEDCAPPSPPRSLLASFSYEYDADDQIKQISFAGQGINFPSDPATPLVTGTFNLDYYADGKLQNVTPLSNQPKSVSFAYGYDAASNLTQMQSGGEQTNFLPNSLNQISTPANIVYDGDGNLSTNGSTGITFQWAFAAEKGSAPVTLGQADSLLTGMQYASGASTAFTYDGLGRRTEIVERNHGTVTSDKRYVWCGYEICQEHDMTAANSSQPGGPVTKSYFPQGMQLYGFYNYYYTRDRQHSVYQMLGTDGTVYAQYQYDPYGTRTAATQLNTVVTSDIGYTGLFEHQQSGVKLAVSRAYLPSIGRWLSRDPLGEFANPAGPAGSAFDTNLYAYGKGDPLHFSDPSGTCVEDLCVGEAALVAAAFKVIEPELPELEAEATITVQELIDAGWQFHHWFPQQFESEFDELGLDVHQWTTALPGDLHWVLHQEGWNEAWWDWLQEADELGYTASDAGDYLMELLQPYLQELEEIGVAGPNGLCAVVPYPGQ